METLVRFTLCLIAQQQKQVIDWLTTYNTVRIINNIKASDWLIDYIQFYYGCIYCFTIVAFTDGMHKKRAHEWTNYGSQHTLSSGIVHGSLLVPQSAAVLLEWSAMIKVSI